MSAAIIAVDPLTASSMAAVPDPVSKSLTESARFASIADGYVRLANFAIRWEQRRCAVEGRFAAYLLVDWFNSKRLHGAIGHVLPAEDEASYYAQPNTGS